MGPVKPLLNEKGERTTINNNNYSNNIVININKNYPHSTPVKTHGGQANLRSLAHPVPKELTEGESADEDAHSANHKSEILPPAGGRMVPGTQAPVARSTENSLNQRAKYH